MSFSLVTVLFVCICITASTSATATSAFLRDYSNATSCDSSQSELAAYAEATVSGLEKAGYRVEVGEFKFIKALGFGANPSSTYGVWEAPKTADKVPLFWQDEADLAFQIGCSSPRGKYFSYRSYVFDAHHDGKRVNEFASLGDAANDLVFNTTGTGAGEPYGAFNHTFALVSLSDANTLSDFRSALSSSGFPSSAGVNVDIIPSNLLKLGRDPLTADSLLMLARVALFDDEAAGAAYKAATMPVYFAFAPNPKGSRPLVAPPTRPRGTGHTEASLASSVAKLKAALLAAEGATLTGSATAVKVPIYGFQCIQNGTECAGDNHDTTYGAVPLNVYVRALFWVECSMLMV